jgi:hypothetical protein
MQTDFGTARRSRTQWQALLARSARSGLSVADLCRREGASTASFYTWRRRLGAAAAQVPPAAAPTCGPAFLDLGPLGAGGEAGIAVGFGAGWEIELDLDAGAVLRLRRR